MKYSMDQFKPGEAWLVFRLNLRIQNQPVDTFFMIDVASTYILGNAMVLGELPAPTEVAELMQSAFNTKQRWPEKFFFPQQDSAEKIFRTYCEKKSITFKVIPLEDFENIIAPIKESFVQFSQNSDNW